MQGLERLLDNKKSIANLTGIKQLQNNKIKMRYLIFVQLLQYVLCNSPLFHKLKQVVLHFGMYSGILSIDCSVTSGVAIGHIPMTAFRTLRFIGHTIQRLTLLVKSLFEIYITFTLFKREHTEH